LINRKERIGRNPKKPEQTVVIPAHKAIKFKPGKDMRVLVAMKKAAKKRAAKGKK
jgi:nucleoid DNA-binding protein